MTPLVHERLFEKLRNHYPQLCTIQQPQQTQDASGEEILIWPPDGGGVLPGHEAVPCYVSTDIGRRSDERQGGASSYSERNLVIGLAGYYPLITPRMRAVVEGHAYDIGVVTHDSQRATTRLAVDEVL